MMQAQLAQGQAGSVAPLLAVRDVSVVFGGIVALNGVSFDMHKGKILGLIGPNGAGKTTLFNCLSRLYQPSKGDILLEGESILTRPATRSPKSASAAPSRTSHCFPISRCSTTSGSVPTPAPAATSSAIV